MKNVKRVWLALGYERWREAEIKKPDARAKELGVKVVVARLGAMDGVIVHATKPATLTIKGMRSPDRVVMVGVAVSISEPGEQELGLATRHKTANDSKHYSGIFAEDRGG